MPIEYFEIPLSEGLSSIPRFRVTEQTNRTMRRSRPERILWLFQIIYIKNYSIYCVLILLCTKVNEENKNVKTRPSVFEKISTLPGSIFPKSLAIFIFFIYGSFTKLLSRENYVRMPVSTDSYD